MAEMFHSNKIAYIRFSNPVDIWEAISVLERNGFSPTVEHRSKYEPGQTCHVISGEKELVEDMRTTLLENNCRNQGIKVVQENE